MSVPSEALLAEAEALLPQAVELRRTLHRYPELGLELPRTKACVMEVLGEIGDLQIVESERTSGVVATLKGAGNGPTILLRGDMDALPMPEDTGLEFASEVDGCMHAWVCWSVFLLTRKRYTRREHTVRPPGPAGVHHT